ncbi:SPOR domain-containing protein [Thalassotalea eurytherma]|uniref:SPOR domain-containing protein n=1 Tax=Thalassotalea eurytherma TaxID=1144278 RepID=A0ABQ6H4D1_9GAMM|nr:hypothetical protein [Thalassotalea eurytherma]GLX82025.1 hypothetical protein theurythT_14770 [Thalassotalea eurytherma]
MSALKNLTHIAHARTVETQENTKAVTNISVHARVDYTLRFSTPAVYVLGNDQSAYNHVASHYIESVDNNRNLAYISCSSQLNNIQMRCRIVEQLFGEQLFDPEEPLSVSIINMMKKQRQAISIVLEHSQCLSLQIIHEVCQLAQIAKKSHQDIQVLLVGSAETGYLIFDNALLFKDKVTIVKADDAQLINLQSKALKRPTTLFSLPKGALYTALFASLSGLLLAATYSLWQMDVLNFSNLTSAEPISLETELTKPVMANEILTPEADSQVNTINQLAAQPLDVLNALNGIRVEEEVTAIEIAKPVDILAALTLSDLKKERVKEPLISQPESLKQVVTKPSLYPEHDIYKISQQGYVIQYGGFSQESVKQSFINQFPSLSYLSYQRLLSDKQLQVLTSEIYPTKIEAQQALASLEPSLLARHVWIKDISAIKDEISAFESSQLK